MESECEMCGCKDMTGTWHNLCFTCVGKLKARVERLEAALRDATEYERVYAWGSPCGNRAHCVCTEALEGEQ